MAQKFDLIVTYPSRNIRETKVISNKPVIMCTHSNLQEHAMLDSVEVKDEIEDAKRNIDNLFLSTKVNLLFLLIVLLWIFLLQKCIILNTVFLAHVMILVGVYATRMGVNFYVNFLP